MPDVLRGNATFRFQVWLTGAGKAGTQLTGTQVTKVSISKDDASQTSCWSSRHDILRKMLEI